MPAPRGNDGFVVPVEGGQILQFARAIGDLHPVYVDEAHSRAMGFANVLAPPTYLMVADHFDPDFERRPRAGRPTPAEDAPALFHVEQRFEYNRHVTAGETLDARRLPPRTWEKQGRRGGNLEFIETITEFRDTAGDLVVSAAWVDVRTSKDHASLSTSQVAIAASHTDAGSAHDVVLVENLSRTQIVMYVGAAGDFHPLHHDEVFARDHGYPGVFAPGMLTMAISARAATERLGYGTLTRLSSRFRAQVWPGDTLIGRITNVSDRDVRIETVNQHGALVLETDAAARRE